MEIHLPDGMLAAARYAPSPHFDARPDNTLIDMIVVHNISLPPAQFGGDYVEQFFGGKLNPSLHPYFETIRQLRVSSHLFIRRAGEMIQFVPFAKRAWHAGESFFKGQKACNDFSIGIELEGTDDLSYEKIQYERLAGIIRALQRAYPAIVRERIVGHADIAPGRKTDPGASFDWQYLDGLLR